MITAAVASDNGRTKRLALKVRSACRVILYDRAGTGMWLSGKQMVCIDID